MWICMNQHPIEQFKKQKTKRKKKTIQSSQSKSVHLSFTNTWIFLPINIVLDKLIFCYNNNNLKMKAIY